MNERATERTRESERESEDKRISKRWKREKETTDKKRKMPRKIIWNGKASETRTHPSDRVSISLVKCLKVIFAAGDSTYIFHRHTSDQHWKDLFIHATIFSFGTIMPGSTSRNCFLLFVRTLFSLRWTIIERFMCRLWRSIVRQTLRHLQLRW